MKTKTVDCGDVISFTINIEVDLIQSFEVTTKDGIGTIKIALVDRPTLVLEANDEDALALYELIRSKKSEHTHDNWIETAKLAQRNSDYYRGLLIQIGEIIGKKAHACDDGTISEDVLCAKLPEIVKGLIDASTQ